MFRPSHASPAQLWLDLGRADLTADPVVVCRLGGVDRRHQLDGADGGRTMSVERMLRGFVAHAPETLQARAQVAAHELIRRHPADDAERWAAELLLAMAQEITSLQLAHERACWELQEARAKATPPRQVPWLGWVS